MTRPTVILCGTLLALAACGGKPKPETPSPDAGADQTAIPARSTLDDGGREARDAERARAAAKLAETIYFGYDEAKLTPASRAILDAKAAVLKGATDMHVVINGHADERGSDEYNLALGMRRATAAQRYLIRSGIAASRVEVVSYGEERPATPGHDERAYAANRRDEFSISGTAISRQ